MFISPQTFKSYSLPINKNLGARSPKGARPQGGQAPIHRPEPPLIFRQLIRNGWSDARQGCPVELSRVEEERWARRHAGARSTGRRARVSSGWRPVAVRRPPPLADRWPPVMSWGLKWSVTTIRRRHPCSSRTVQLSHIISSSLSLSSHASLSATFFIPHQHSMFPLSRTPTEIRRNISWEN